MTILHVHSSTVGDANGVNTIGSGALATTTGNLIVVSISVCLGSSITSVTDTAGNTYSLKKSATSNSRSIYQYAVENATGNAANVATVLFGGSEIGNIQQHEFSGIATATAADKSASGTETSSGTHSTAATATLSQADELVVASGMGAFPAAANAPSMTDGTYTSISNTNGGNNQKFCTAYKVVAATTAVDWNGWTSDSVGDAASAIVTYKGAAATATDIIPLSVNLNPLGINSYGLRV